MGIVSNITRENGFKCYYKHLPVFLAIQHEHYANNVTEKNTWGNISAQSKFPKQNCQHFKYVGTKREALSAAPTNEVIQAQGNKGNGTMRENLTTEQVY